MRELGEGMRRIFELMKMNDLTPPELNADNNVFTVTLHHRYVYTPEQKLWLESFDRFNLSREQKTIVLLGYNSHTISPREIWDAVGIVDTEYYRQVIVSLQKIGILKSTINKARAQALAKRHRTTVKNIARFSISLPAVAGASETERVSPLEQPKQRPLPFEMDSGDYARVFVGNVPFRIQPNDLVSLLSQFGPLEDVVVPVDPLTRRPRGYAFAEFENSVDAVKAVKNTGTIRIDGRALVIREARPRSPSSGGPRRRAVTQ